MDELKALQGLGLEMPSPAYLIGAVLFGIAGLIAFRMGRKGDRPVTLWLGVVLMFYPYAVSNTWTLWAIGCVLCAALWWDHMR
jgi:hypothetical protein